MELIFLGTDAVTPAAGDDSACGLLDRRILIDCGWHAAWSLQDHGLSAVDLTWVLLTHCHHDHYMGLPQVLFWRWMKGVTQPLQIAGPAEDLARVVDLSLAFLQIELFGGSSPHALHPLKPGDALEVEGLRVTTSRTIHPVPSLCYRFDGPDASLAWTGDTAYEPALVEHVRGVDLLVHEATYGAQSSVMKERDHGHSGAPEAAAIARDGAVGRLALVHSPADKREGAVKAARKRFANSFWPEVGEAVVVGAPR